MKKSIFAIVGKTDYKKYCNTFCSNFPNMFLLSANVMPNSGITIGSMSSANFQR